jgi:hypothetical protein
LKQASLDASSWQTFTMADALQALVAKQEITEVLYRYCHAVDRNDRDSLRSVWHEDGRADYGQFFNGSADGFVDAVLEAHSHATALSHQVTNILIEVEGDRATSTTYVTALVRVPGKDFVSRNLYHDIWSCRSKGWAIDERSVTEPILQVLRNENL